MAVEAMNYWMTGKNSQVSAEISHSIQGSPAEVIDIEWEPNHQYHRSLTGPQGTEFQVNNNITNDQTYPSIAALPNGGYVITWTSTGQDGSGDGVYAQRYDATGVAYGSEFRVNTDTVFDEWGSRIASFSNNEFIITWAEDGIYAQRYAASGTPYGSQFTVISDYDADSWSAVATLPDGGYVITWKLDFTERHYPYTYYYSNIYAQRYYSSGIAYGSEFRVSGYRTHQCCQAIAALADGGYIISWLGETAYVSGLYAQRYTASGADYGSKFLVSVDGVYSSIAALADGGYLITYDEEGFPGWGYHVYAQRYLSSGAIDGAKFRVNTDTSGSRGRPAIAVLADKGYVITWMSNGQDGSGYGIYAQRYDAFGVAYGLEFQVNTYTIGDQRYPAIAALPDGGFIITWMSDGQDGSGYGIYGQRFNSNGEKIGQVFTSSPTLDPTVNPTFFPTLYPSFNPTLSPTQLTVAPTFTPTSLPTPLTFLPTLTPIASPSINPTSLPTASDLIKFNQKSDQSNSVSWVIVGPATGGSVIALLIAAGMVFYCYQQTQKESKYTLTPVVPKNEGNGLEMTVQQIEAASHDQNKGRHFSNFFSPNSSSHQIVSAENGKNSCVL